MSNQSLGRGLGALIPGAGSMPSGQAVSAGARPDSYYGQEIRRVAVDKIASNPWQPRHSFDQEKMSELAASIKQYGILQPLVLSPGQGESFQLIAGERRLRAAQLAGLTEVPAIIRQAEDHEKLELALVENIQRQNLNALDEAGSYRRLMDEFNLTQEEVAGRVGKSRSTVANFLRLLNLPAEVKEAIRSEKISFSHAKVIAGLPDTKAQINLLKRIIAQDMPVSELQKKEQHVREHIRTVKDPVLVTLQEKLTRYFGSKVIIKQEKSGGLIELQWQTDEDLKRIVDLLMSSEN